MKTNVMITTSKNLRHLSSDPVTYYYNLYYEPKNIDEWWKIRKQTNIGDEVGEICISGENIKRLFPDLPYPKNDEIALKEYTIYAETKRTQ